MTKKEKEIFIFNEEKALQGWELKKTKNQINNQNGGDKKKSKKSFLEVGSLCNSTKILV